MLFHLQSTSNHVYINKKYVILCFLAHRQKSSQDISRLLLKTWYSALLRFAEVCRWWCFHEFFGFHSNLQSHTGQEYIFTHISLQIMILLKLYLYLWNCYSSTIIMSSEADNNLWDPYCPCKVTKKNMIIIVLGKQFFRISKIEKYNFELYRINKFTWN